MKTLLVPALFTFLVLLSGCTKPPTLPPTLQSPGVSVSKTTASVNEFVKVTVTGAVRLDTPNASERVGLVGLILGVCLIPEDQPVDTEGIGCRDFELPKGFKVAGNIPLYIEQDVTVNRGETVTLTHSIELSSALPQGVTLVGYYAFRGEGTSPEISDIYTREELRAFTEFR